MSFIARTATAFFALGFSTALAQTADTQQTPPPTTPPPTTPPQPFRSTLSPYGEEAKSDPSQISSNQPPPTEDPNAPPTHKSGDFDAGARARFPSGPDEMGEYDSFNWVAVDLNGRYFLLPSVTLNGNIPLAVKKPDTILGGAVDPRLIGGMSITLDARIPKLPTMPFVKTEVELGLALTAAYMREGAMLLSEKDFPLFIGDFQPGFGIGLTTKTKLSSLLDFSLIPTFVFQTGDAENLTALQFPMSLIVKLGNVLKVSADAGIFTGDDISLSAANGGRIYLGAALDLKLGPIILHSGAGFASLLTDDMGAYQSVGDSLYVDLNVKYAR